MNHHALVSGQPALCLRTRTTRTAARFASSSSSLALALALGNKPNNISSSPASSSPSTNLAKLLPLVPGAFTRRRTIPVANGQPLSGYTTNDAHDGDGLKPTDNISFASAKEALFGLHPGGVRSELILLALPAVFSQAIDPMAQLMETAYIGRLGALELASAGIGVSIFNIVSKIFNIPLLSIATSYVAEDISKNASKHSSSGKLELSSVSSALILAAGIGIIEALALFLGSGLFLKLMGVSPASPMHKLARLFLSLRALGAPANVVMLAVQGIFRGFKDTKTPVFYIGLGNLSAVVLLPLLIYGFRLGITGAAISTVASQQCWYFILHSVGLSHLAPAVSEPYFDAWWERVAAAVTGEVRKGLNSLIILGAWCIWKHRNSCVFNAASPSIVNLLNMVREEAELWTLTGARGLTPRGVD